MLNIVSPWYDHMACHKMPTGAWGEVIPIAWFYSLLDFRDANISPSLANSSSLLCVIVGIYSRQNIGVDGSEKRWRLKQDNLFTVIFLLFVGIRLINYGVCTSEVVSQR